MQVQIRRQVDRWLEIVILEKYSQVDEMRFPIGDFEGCRPSIQNAQRRLKDLISRTCRRFDLAPPDSEDTQKKSFTEWRREMLATFCCINYGRMLCSFCPLSLGMDEMIRREGAAPCVLLDDTKLFSFEPEGCVILTSNFWTEKFLIQHITMQHGPDKVADFLGVKQAFYMAPSEQ